MDAESEAKVSDAGEGKSFKSRLHKMFLEPVFFDNHIKVITVSNFTIFLLMMHLKTYTVLTADSEL